MSPPSISIRLGMSIISVFVLFLCWGCASRRVVRTVTSTPEPETRVAVLPARWLTLTRSFEVDGARLIAEAFTEIPGVSMVSPSDCADIMADEDPSCVQETECLRRVGSELGADWVIVVNLAEFGGTVLVRASMVRVSGGTEQETRQERVEGATGDQISASLRRLGEGLARPLEPTPELVAETPRPWYRRWWVWTIVGTTAAGVGVSLATVLTLDENDDEPPEVVFTPP